VTAFGLVLGLARLESAVNLMRMRDYFAVLGIARRPWVEEEVIKSRFFELSGQAHPDRVVGGDPQSRSDAEKTFSELNAAQLCLKNPRERLLHLLALEGYTDRSKGEQVPAVAMEFFAPVGELNKRVDHFLAEKKKAASPIVKAGLFQEGLEWTIKIQDLQEELSRRMNALQEEIKRIDEQWETMNDDQRGAVFLRLSELAQSLGFLQKWRAQLQERMQALAF
jgi:curved DNA-binding protein CbpA